MLADIGSFSMKSRDATQMSLQLHSESALTQAESSLFGDLVKREEQTMNSLMVTIEKHC